MALKIRLARGGSKKTPVLPDCCCRSSSTARWALCRASWALITQWQPKEHEQRLDAEHGERVAYWLGQGATAT